MGYKKCPICEVNYIRDDEEYCELCRKEMGEIPKKKVTIDIDKIGVRALKHLIKGMEYGTNSQEIYLQCCKGMNFNHDADVLDCFGYKRPLYANKVAENKYSVWFLAHSNFTDDQAGDWKNTIYKDRIEEEHFKCDYQYAVNDIRITFVYVSGCYYFYGVYEQRKVYTNSDGHKVFVYYPISDVYPM